MAPEEPYEDNDDHDCPICRGEELSPEFVATILAARPLGKNMDLEEAREWVNRLSAGSSLKE
jgi:hypothetical protein